MNPPPFSIITNCTIHETVRIIGWANLYGCVIEEGAFIGPHVEIGQAAIGARTKISSHCYLCPGVEIGPDCFIGHGVMFTNDLYNSPEVYDHIGDLAGQWELKKTTIGKCVRIGSNATILPVNIGDHCVIGAGAVVTRDVPPYSVVVGNPGRAQIKLNPTR